MKYFFILLLTPIIVFGQGLPQIINENNQLIYHKAYTLSYNESCEQANWVKYMVTKIELESFVAKRKNNFSEDKMVITGSATYDDYRGSGYDRGHLAPAATFVDNQEEMDESFHMSNISPQHPSFNRGIWKRLEEYERQLAMENDTIYVITGGVLNGELKTIGENGVCVPKLFYKIIYGNGFSVGFIIRNEKSDEKLYIYKQPIDVIEKVVGIDFMLK